MLVCVCTGSECVSLAIFTTASAIVFCALLKLVLPSTPRKPPLVNQEVKKDNPKVVDLLEIEDFGEKVSYCRCWRSSKVTLWPRMYYVCHNYYGCHVCMLFVMNSCLSA